MVAASKVDAGYLQVATIDLALVQSDTAVDCHLLIGAAPHGIVGAALPVVGVEPVTPALALVGVGEGFKTGAEVYIGAERVYLFIQQVAARVVVPYIGFVRGMVVLPSQSVQTVIVILGEQGSALADSFEIARLVIGVTERGRIGVCTVDMACHA